MKNAVKAYFRVPFTMIVWVMETYAKNRATSQAFMTSPRAALALKIALAITVVAWIYIGITATDEDGKRLTDTLKSLWSDTMQLNEDKKALNLEMEGPAK